VSPDQAERLLRMAVQWAQSRGAYSFELRAARDLARLVRTEETRMALAHLYSSFTQGFNTIDLKECKEVLEITTILTDEF
jgi:predicted ATPase